MKGPYEAAIVLVPAAAVPVASAVGSGKEGVCTLLSDCPMAAAAAGGGVGLR